MDVETSSDGVVSYTSETEDAGGCRIPGWLCPLVFYSGANFSRESGRQSALPSLLSFSDITLRQVSNGLEKNGIFFFLQGIADPPWNLYLFP